MRKCVHNNSDGGGDDDGGGGGHRNRMGHTYKVCIHHQWSAVHTAMQGQQSLVLLMPFGSQLEIG